MWGNLICFHFKMSCRNVTFTWEIQLHFQQIQATCAGSPINTFPVHKIVLTIQRSTLLIKLKKKKVQHCVGHLVKSLENYRCAHQQQTSTDAQNKALVVGHTVLVHNSARSIPAVENLWQYTMMMSCIITSCKYTFPMSKIHNRPWSSGYYIWNFDSHQSFIKLPQLDTNTGYNHWLVTVYSEN